MSLMAEGVGHVGALIRAEANAKIADTNRRLDDLERLVRRNNHYDKVTDDLLHDVVLARMQCDDDSPYWDFCSDHHISMAQLDVMLKDFERRAKRG